MKFGATEKGELQGQRGSIAFNPWSTNRGFFCAVASTVRCSLWECVVQAAQRLVEDVPASLPINHAFRRAPVYSQTRHSHHSWTFSSPPSLGEAVRIHTHTHTHIQTLSWKCCGPTENAGEGGGTLEQDCLLIQRSMIFNNSTRGICFQLTWKLTEMHLLGFSAFSSCSTFVPQQKRGSVYFPWI